VAWRDSKLNSAVLHYIGCSAQREAECRAAARIELVLVCATQKIKLHNSNEVTR
jgi:hypothetical protein